MRCVLLMFDSPNRRHLSPYGCDWTRTPNFARLANRACTFDQSYVGSMPCMPALRDLHMWRPGFLHRGGADGAVRSSMRGVDAPPEQFARLGL